MKNKIILILFTLMTMPQLSFSQLKSVIYNDDSQKLAGFFGKAKGKTNNNAGVLILPAWMGIDDHSIESAIALNALGYHTFVADIYGAGNKPNSPQEAGKIAGSYKKNIQNYHKSTDLILITQ